MPDPKMARDVDILIDLVKAEFGSIAFPSHCGLRAAIAMDDWISDLSELRRITAEQDVKGEWWEIPESELKNISLASCYLDASGTQFYLPALLVAVLRGLKHEHCAALVTWLTPLQNEPDCALYEHFVAKFTSLTQGQRGACMHVLRHVASQDDPKDPWTRQEIEELLRHEYWQASANEAFHRSGSQVRT